MKKSLFFLLFFSSLFGETVIVSSTACLLRDEGKSYLEQGSCPDEESLYERISTPFDITKSLKNANYYDYYADIEGFTHIQVQKGERVNAEKAYFFPLKEKLDLYPFRRLPIYTKVLINQKPYLFFRLYENFTPHIYKYKPHHYLVLIKYDENIYQKQIKALNSFRNRKKENKSYPSMNGDY